MALFMETESTSVLLFELNLYRASLQQKSSDKTELVLKTGAKPPRAQFGGVAFWCRVASRGAG